MRSDEIFNVQDEGRIASMCSYFFVLGWSVSYFGYHKTEKTANNSFHLRQTLLLYVSYIAIRFGVLVIVDKAGVLTGNFSMANLAIFVNLVFIALWLFGLASASKGEQKHIPLIGKPAQVLFQAI